MLIGYARVSTEKQNLEMQIQALEKAGCSKIFAEKVTGTRADRPEYIKMKEYARDAKDTIVVYKLDRLGRSLKHLISEVQEFNNRGIGFKSVQENIDTNTPSGKFFFHMFAAIAEFEKDIIKERTLTGLNAARARGRLGGRPKKLTDNQLVLMKRMHADKNNSIQEICDTFKISRPTLFRHLRVYE